MTDSIRIAVVQPAVEDGPEDGRIEQALGFINDAAEQDAELVLFPEGFPGPLKITSEYDASGPIAGAAERGGLAVCWSRIEQVADGSWRKVAHITGSDGTDLLRYERAHPATGDVHPTLSGTHLSPGEGFGITAVAGVRVGVLICSELWVPEVSRILALEGAEVILAPAGGGFHRVAPNWQMVTRVRAIENQCYVAMTQHLFGSEVGAALIAGPEQPVAQLTEPGMMVADLDLERVRWLRRTDDSMEEPKQFDSLPGLLRMRRPEIYEGLTVTREDRYDYLNPPEVPEELMLPGAFRGIDK